MVIDLLQEARELELIEELEGEEKSVLEEQEKDRGLHSLCEKGATDFWQGDALGSMA